MHHIIFLLARIIPYIGIPTAILSFELGIAFRRKNKKIRYLFWAITVVSLVFSILWIFFRGDLYSDEWVQDFLDGLDIKLENFYNNYTNLNENYFDSSVKST